MHVVVNQVIDALYINTLTLFYNVLASAPDTKSERKCDKAVRCDSEIAYFFSHIQNNFI